MPSTESALTVSQLAQETQVPVARIKYYLRERLLPQGDLAAEKRAYYHHEHVTRLRLIHALRQVAGLPVSAIGALCALLDGEGENEPALLVAHVIDAIGRSKPGVAPSSSPEHARAKRELSALFAERGVKVRKNAAALEDLARALCGVRTLLGPGVTAQGLVPYLDAMLHLAEHDFTATRELVRDGASAALAATYGTVLWEPVLLYLRRIAHEHVATEKLPGVARPRARTLRSKERGAP